MKRKTIYWTPRVLSVAMIVFISLFAFDVFIEDYTFWELIGAFLIHLLPSFMLLGIVLIAWKREQIGGLIFITLGVLYMIMTANREMLLPGMIITFPVTLIGILFIISGTKYQSNNLPAKESQHGRK